MQHEWLPSAEAVLAEAREATVGWSRRLGTSTVVVLVHPSIAEAVSARRGMSRFHEKASRVTDLHTVPPKSEPEDIALARMVWQLERLSEQETLELKAFWCRPATPPPAAEEPSDDSDSDGSDGDGSAGDGGDGVEASEGERGEGEGDSGDGDGRAGEREGVDDRVGEDGVDVAVSDGEEVVRKTDGDKGADPTAQPNTKGSQEEAQALWQQVGDGTWMYEHDKASGFGNPFDRVELARIQSQDVAVEPTDELCTVAIATVVSDKDDMDDMSVCTTPHEIAHDLHDHLADMKLHDTEQTHTYEIAEQLRVLQLEQHVQQQQEEQQVQQYEQQHEQQRHEEVARTEAQPADAAPRRTNPFATPACREEDICEENGDTSSNSSLEEWEATEDGGFARVEVGESVWYVYGFEPDGRGGWCELWRRHPARDPFETYTRPRALRPSRPGPPWVPPPPRGGARRGPGGIPAGPGFSFSPGARPMGVPGTLRSADRNSAYIDYHSSS